MPIRAIKCNFCGASIEWDGSYGEQVKCTYCASTFIPAATELEKVWRMTDPVARARYEFDGTMDKLEHDIRYEVMRGQDWSILDQAYTSEITRLEKDGIIRKLATFWAVSPHPSVYSAQTDGELQLGEHRLLFQKGDEIVWACPMTRDRFGLDFPVLIGDFRDAEIQRLCGVMVNAMQGRMG